LATFTFGPLDIYFPKLATNNFQRGSAFLEHTFKIFPEGEVSVVITDAFEFYFIS